MRGCWHYRNDQDQTATLTSKIYTKDPTALLSEVRTGSSQKLGTLKAENGGDRR
jgi:hypothetical protein